MFSSPHFRGIMLAILLALSSARGGVVLRVDVNDALDSPSDTVAGYAGYVLADDTLAVPPFTVDVNPAGGAALDDVHRTTPLNGGALTLAALYRDGIFAAGDNTANFYRVGIDTVITGLTAGKKYTLTVWGFDSGSAGARTSDWSVLGLGGPQFAANNFSFNGSTLPTVDTANRFTVDAYADAAGRLTLRGRPAAQGTTAQVFLNGFTVDELAAGAVQANTVLALDFNDRSFAGATYTQAGFSEFILDGTTTTQTTATRNFGGITVTLAGSSVTVDDRERTGVPGNSGAFTNSTLLRDFVFATSGAVGTGLDVTVGGLAPNTLYLVELWSFDSGSTSTVRTSDWTVNGAFLWDDYGFNGANLPATSDDYKMAGTFTTNASGQFVISGRLVANAPAVFIDALRISQLAPAQIVDFGHPILSEFLAENKSGIQDEDGATSDWIEIWNTTSGTLNLAGWHLSDNPGISTKWTFPTGVSLPSQGRIVVWASGKNRTGNPAALHTNFALNKLAGSYLALYQPGGTNAITVFSNLPEQRQNVSYGLAGTAEPLTAGFFATPTPGGANGTQVPGFVADTQFDFKRGFYSAPVNVHITCATPGATIFYTTDGSEPTTTSAAYPGAVGIPISTSTVLRARAFAAPLAPSNTDTQTYLFNTHVQNQTANPAGWPATWGTDSSVGLVPGDYEMDPNVTGSTLPGYSVNEAMAGLPAMSIVMEPSDFHSVGAGIYANPKSLGLAWEKACSVELLEQAGGGFHTSCGIRVHGNSSRNPSRMQKHSFRVSFRSEYGDGKLDYKLFSDTTLKSFDKLVLHAFFTDGYGLVSWTEARYRPETAVTFRDPFLKRCFADMGHQSVSGQHMHLFINGLYWGIYEVGERVDDVWASDHLGGLPTDWDIIAPDTTTAVQLKNGNLSAWNALFTLVNTPDLTVQANYEAVVAQTNLSNFVDYYLLHIHGDAEDWPHHNGYAIRNRNAAGAKWQFVPWDQEISFDPLVLVDRLSPGAPNTAGNGNAPLTTGVLYQKLRASAEFRLLFADRAHKHLHNGGALSLAVEQARWQSFVDLLDKPIVAECARWGDTADATPYGNAVLPQNETLKRETHWLPQVNSVKNSHMPMLHNTANSNSTIAELRAQSLYPITEPPDFSQFGGNVPANYALTMSAPAGTIYYTTNGSDPRTAFTGAASGTPYAAPATLTQTATVKARALNSGVWSALTEATFIVGTAASSANLTVTELHYNPQITQDHEFIELTNFSAGPIDLTGVQFEGITFTFADATVLAAGERIVVARNQAAFVAQYGAGPHVAGQFSDALDNTGEQIAVLAANGADIVRFTYNDKAPWPTAPDGSGRSLVLRAAGANPANAASWRSSTAPGGNPGASDSVAFTGTPLADADGDGVCALLEHILGTSDAVPSVGSLPAVAIEFFDIGAGPQPFITLTVSVNLAADDCTMTSDFSTNLNAWDDSPAGVVFLGESNVIGGAAVLKWRATVPMISGTPRQFLRLRATFAP